MAHLYLIDSLHQASGDFLSNQQGSQVSPAAERLCLLQDFFSCGEHAEGVVLALWLFPGYHVIIIPGPWKRGLASNFLIRGTYPIYIYIYT